MFLQVLENQITTLEGGADGRAAWAGTAISKEKQEMDQATKERDRIRDTNTILEREVCDLEATRSKIETERNAFDGDRWNLDESSGVGWRRGGGDDPTLPEKTIEVRGARQGATAKWGRVRQSVANSSPNRGGQLQAEGDIPKGFAFWFATHANPRILALSAPEAQDFLLEPSRFALQRFGDRAMPTMSNALVAEALAADLNVTEQKQRLVPDRLSEDQFWKNYYSHIYAIRAEVGDEARAVAFEHQRTKEGKEKTQTMAQSVKFLCETFREVMAEGVEIMAHAGDRWAPLLIYYSFSVDIMFVSLSIGPSYKSGTIPLSLAAGLNPLPLLLLHASQNF